LRRETGAITLAPERINISQASISTAISPLEAIHGRFGGGRGGSAEKTNLIKERNVVVPPAS
jgi:hypothetical protein